MFIESKFGNAVLVDKAGYKYRTSHSPGNNKTYWRCRNSDKYKCNARAVTQDHYVKSWSGAHNHPEPH